MADANLLKAISDAGKGNSLNDLVLFGRVRCAIKRPKVVGSKLETVDYGAFAILDAFAIKCLKFDYFRDRNSVNGSSVYFTKGSLIIYIDDTKWVGKDVKVYGTRKGYGTKVRRQWGAVSESDGVTALAFKMVGSNFVVTPNAMIELGKKDPDAKLTPLEDFVVKLKKDEPIEYPVTLDGIMNYEVADYEELQPDTIISNSRKFISDDKMLDISKIDMNLTYHLEGMEESPLIEAIEDEIEENSYKRTKYVKELINEVLSKLRDIDSGDYAGKIRQAFVSRIAENYAVNVGKSRIKGSVYVDEFIDAVGGLPIGMSAQEMPSYKKSDADKMCQNLKSMYKSNPSILNEKYVNSASLPMLESDLQVASAIIGVCSGIGMSTLRSNYYVCKKEFGYLGLSFELWFALLLHYPYALGMLGSSLPLVELDRIYFSFTKYFTDNTLSKENGEMRSDLLYLNSLEGASDKDIIVTEGVLRRSTAGYPNRGKNMLENNKFPANKDIIELLSVLCGGSVLLTDKESSYLVNMPWFSKQRTESLAEKGIVELIDDGSLLLEKDLEKQYFIYKVLIGKGHEETGITDEQVEDCINSFEEKSGFQLESLQRDGIKLTQHKAGVLSGCAGSGKTTTSECMSDCLRANMPKGYSIVYCTPTGKACRRLAEVVGGTVKTLHSQFRIGLFGDSYLSSVESFKQYEKKLSKSIYILDEMAMCNSNLLYNVVSNLSKDDLVYFLGDIKQLPPIGKGNPFYLLMKILPCVELGVSKRAAEGSKVNYNTVLLNHLSDKEVHEFQYDKDSFIVRECLDPEIPAEVSKVWREFMEGKITGTKYKEDDIQVITGYATPSKTFSTVNLNPPLQKFLRSSDKLLFRYGDRDFYKNERVIHVNTNAYGMQRYVEVAPNQYKAVVTFGMINGEMCKIEGIICSTAVEIEDFSEEDYKDERFDFYSNLSNKEFKDILAARNERDDLREDSKIHDANTYFVKVKTYDVDLRRDVYAFYMGREHMEGDIRYLTGGDLNNLDLAYALTTHKMQGSQSPVVICVYGSTCSENFINRNMINVMITRSQGIVCMLGSVLAEDSPVNRGRCVASEFKTNDVLSLLVGEE